MAQIILRICDWISNSELQLTIIPLLTNEIKPPFTATKSLISKVDVEITKCAFTPIIPHLATESE